MTRETAEQRANDQLQAATRLRWQAEEMAAQAEADRAAARRRIQAARSEAWRQVQHDANLAGRLRAQNTAWQAFLDAVLSGDGPAVIGAWLAYVAESGRVRAADAAFRAHVPPPDGSLPPPPWQPDFAGDLSRVADRLAGQAGSQRTAELEAEAAALADRIFEDE